MNPKTISIKTTGMPYLYKYPTVPDAAFTDGCHNRSCIPVTILL